MIELERRLREGENITCTHRKYLVTDGDEDAYRAEIGGRGMTSISLLGALEALEDQLAKPMPQEPCVRHESDGSMPLNFEASVTVCKRCHVLFRKP